MNRLVRPLATLVILMATCAMASTPISDRLSAKTSHTQALSLPEGRLAYEDSGHDGPIVLCIPGLGDTRGQFRLFAPALVASGYRVVTVDPPGQGDSDATFSSYTASAVGDDMLALVDHLQAPVYLIGNSFGGAAAAWIAAKRPDQVRGLVFLDAFLRDPPVSFFQKTALQVALHGPWAIAVWTHYYKSLFIGHPPRDLAEYSAALAASLERPGYLEAMRAMAFSTKADVEARLKDIRAPVLAIAGTDDPDFESPEGEVDWIVQTMHGEKRMIQHAGHYPHLEDAEEVAAAVHDFIGRTRTEQVR